MLRHEQRSILWNFCIGYFGVKNGDTLVLTTVGRQSNMEMQSMVVVTEMGDNYAISVSKFDRWSVVAFIMHGLTDVPVDLIRLYNNGKLMDFTSVIGIIPANTAIVMNIMMNKVNKDISFGIPLKISIGNGIVENIKMAPTRTVKDVKRRLEDIGVPNATLYELTLGIYKLPNKACLQDVITDLDTTLVLRVEKFPVFLHAPDGIIYKTMVEVPHTLKHFKRKFELKTGHANSTCRMLVAGQDLKLPDSAILYENGFSTRTSVFVESSTFHEIFFVTNGDLLVKLKLPIRPTATNIKQVIWSTESLPEGAITCLQTFFFWFFHPRVSRKYQLPKRKKNRKRLPITDHTLPSLSARRVRLSHNDPADIHTDMIEAHYLPKDLRPKSPTSLPANLKHPEREVREISAPWKSMSNYDPGYNRSHPTRMKRKCGHRDKYKVKAYPQSARDVPHHVLPRWMGNLHQKNDANRLKAMNEDGMAYRQMQEQAAGQYLAPQKSDPSWTRRRKGYRPSHHQGEAGFSQKRPSRPTYDRQTVLYSSGSDSDSDDGRYP